MNILLVSANTFTEPYPVYPLGLDYVAGSIPGRHRVTVIDMNDTNGPQGLAAAVRTASPDLVGLSLRNIDNTDVTSSEGFIPGYGELMRAIRGATPSPVVLGGCAFTLFPDALLRELGAEYGIVGEGERFAALLEAIEGGSDPGTIPGIAIPGSPAAVPPPWDGPVRRRFDPGAAHIGYYLKRGGMLNLQSKRGCPHRCIYCTYPHIEGSGLRLFPPEEVAETALALQRAGARYLFVTDAVFNCHPDHSEAVAEAFIRSGLSIPWGAYFSPAAQRGGVFELMKRAGLTHVEFGTESLSDTMLHNYGKPFGVEEALRAHHDAVSAGLHVAHFMLLGGPGEDESTVDETLSVAEGLPRTVLFFFCGIRIYPNTRLHEIALGEGQIGRDDDLLYPLFYRSGRISHDRIIERVRERAGGRTNWVFAAGGETMNRALKKMHRRGHTGPLWEYLVQ
ncbi:MAG: radical SAM protein [Spirochaetes bacterium]|nr:radical SAM protein [Spirochaetota bacterium]